MKVLLSWMADFCIRHGGTDIHSQLRRTLFYGVAAFIWILDHAGEWLKDDEAVAQYEMGYLFLESLQALSANAQSTHECIWKIRPKHHYLCHTIDVIWTRLDYLGRVSILVPIGIYIVHLLLERHVVWVRIVDPTVTIVIQIVAHFISSGIDR